MFAYIKGELAEKTQNYVVIDVNGIGYQIFVSELAISQIGEVGSIVKLHTYYYVREDLICLYGFLNREELRMFELLLSVSGIGAKSAIATLSNITPSSFALAVITDNVATLTKIPGVGKKTAQRLILELKDKIKTEEAVAKAPETQIVLETNENVEEATAALQILGYTKKEVEKALEHVSVENASVEEIIRKCLSILGK
jgi:Holliday junction DNA helicase RuvA